MTDPLKDDHPGVRVPPPLIFLGFLLAGLWWESRWINGQLAETGWMIAGGIMFCIGAVLIVLSAPRHKQAGTNIEPWKPTTTIIDDGVYGRTRNPIYLGMVFCCAGIAVGAQSLAALAATLISLLVVQNYVIAREEAYLEAKFGDEYRDYKSRVRRWL